MNFVYFLLQGRKNDKDDTSRTASQYLAMKSAFHWSTSVCLRAKCNMTQHNTNLGVSGRKRNEWGCHSQIFRNAILSYGEFKSRKLCGFPTANMRHLIIGIIFIMIVILISYQNGFTIINNRTLLSSIEMLVNSSFRWLFTSVTLSRP